MTAIRCQVVLNPNEDPENHVVNTWWCTPVGATDSDAAAQAFATALSVFYNAIDAHMSAGSNGWVPSFTAYDLIDPKPRQPILATALSTLANSSGDSLPRELSVCLSFHGEFVSGVNPARRRGRVYLGPWASAANNGTTGKVTSTVYSAIQSAGNTLLTTSEASSEFRWVVYSPTTDTAGLGGLGVYEVVGGWVDSEWDIQRRRGENGSTTRITF